MSGDNPVIIEIDPASWKGHLGNIETWLKLNLSQQMAFRKLLEKVGPTMLEPHTRQGLGELAETARRHEAEAERFFKLIGRSVATVPPRVESALKASRESADEAVAASGPEASWVGLHSLVPAALAAQTGFAVTEQLALALGIRELAEAAYDVENEQAGGFLMLKELMLEVAAMSILYKMPV